MGADFARFAVCKLNDEGPFPMNKFSKSIPAMTFTFAHHLVSILVGLPVIAYFSDRSDFQFFGAMMTGAPSFLIAPGLLAKCYPNNYEKVHLTSDLWCACNFTYQRAIFFFPATWKLLRQVLDEPLPKWLKACFFIGAFNLSFF